jgi:hypothetical protein
MNRSLGLALLPLAVGGCAAQQSKLMHSTLLIDTTAPATAAIVVFVRDSSPCDGGDPFRLVDDKERFVGESVPSSKFAVRVPPGEHAFFAWQPNGDLPADLYPSANQVGALQLELEAGKTYTVEVSITNATHGMRKTCFAYQFLALRQVNAADPDMADILAKAQPLTPDVVAGQATVDREHAGVEAHIALGTRKLGR